ncbi:hypothetical protein RIF29_25376 [Crotalaria pallida]|uniref:Uncharacterized protein n=1 Tax=Crotalaria pallida TaxID=3830 RepID=A0AAN9HXF2_CROPI
MASNDGNASENKKRGGHGRTIMKTVIQERSKRKKLLEVEWNIKGQPIGSNASRFNSHIGVITRRDASINIEDWRDESNAQVKLEIWEDVQAIWNVDETHKHYVHGKAWIALNKFRYRLTKRVRNGCVDHPPKLYADLIDQEEWDEFVARVTTTLFLEISTANRERALQADCPSRISRKGYAKLEQEILLETKSEEVSLPRHTLYRKAHLDKTGNTNNEKAREKISQIVGLI